MKLNPEFITHTAAGEQIMVATGESSRRFNGLVRSNATAAYVIQLLQAQTTRSALVQALLDRYDAPRETIERDLDALLQQLRSIGALEE